MASGRNIGASKATRLKVVSIADNREIKPKVTRKRASNPVVVRKFYDANPTPVITEPVDLTPLEPRLADIAAAVEALRQSVSERSTSMGDEVEAVVREAVAGIKVPTPVFEVPERGSGLLEVVLSTFASLGYALSARALLLLTLVGSFALAVLAMREPNIMRIVVLVAFMLSTVVPVTVLEIRKTRE